MSKRKQSIALLLLGIVAVAIIIAAGTVPITIKSMVVSVGEGCIIVDINGSLRSVEVSDNSYTIGDEVSVTLTGGAVTGITPRG